MLQVKEVDEEYDMPLGSPQPYVNSWVEIFWEETGEWKTGKVCSYSADYGGRHSVKPKGDAAAPSVAEEEPRRRLESTPGAGPTNPLTTLTILLSEN